MPPPRRRRFAATCGWLAAQLFLLINPAPLPAQGPAAGDRVPLRESVRPVAPMGGASAAVPAALARPTLTDTEAATPLHVTAALKLRRFAELQRRVTAGETVSRAEMAARYLPRESDYRTVAQWLTAQGLTVAAPGASHAVVRASGTPAQLEKAFQTRFARVTFQGAEYTAAVETPSVPAGIEAQVGSVHGLQPYLHPHKFGAPKKAALVSEVGPPFYVRDILTAYNVSASGLTGAGQQIGIVIDTVPHDSDLTTFWADSGINQSLSNIITVNVEGRTLPSVTGEETLDVSWSSGVAPGAQIVIYACGNLNNVNDAYGSILDDLQDGSRPDLHQISMSYGGGEVTEETTADMQSVHEMFTAIAAYGVSLFASSGDDGAYGDDGHTVQVLFPASDPNVTGVGGTSLSLDSTTAAITSETAWTPATPGSDESSSGGGISTYFARPAWQVGATVPVGTMRLVPDVAFAADPNQGCFLILDGRVDQYGGTSWGAPSWAGLCALANQARATAGRPALGVANVALYPALGTAGFHDITSGDNGSYDAGFGYDLVTGLGTPDFTLLLPALLGSAVATTPAVPAITSAPAAAGTVGAAFSYQTTASNSPTAFAASGLPAGLSIDASTGLVSGTPTAAGTSTVTLSATNDGGTGTAALTLTIAASAPLPVVTLTATVPQVTLGSGAVGEATLTIPAALSTDLTVYYSAKGSATNGTDDVFLSGHAKIKAGKTSKLIQVVPQGDLEGAARKVVKITLATGENYTVGTPASVKIDLLHD